MILFNGPNTPFGRMALVTAMELGLRLDNREIVVGTAAFLDALTPLRQIPVLVLDDGQAVFDSRVICAHLASLAPDAGLIPADVTVATRWALVLGLMEAGVARQMERLRPEAQQSVATIAVCERRIEACVARLEAEAAAVCDGFQRIDRIAAAVALDYIDFRYPHAWRDTAPRLGAWLATVTARASMTATRPRPQAR